MTYILKAEIASFGKFCDYEIEFGREYNEFVLENEFGKTTITDFILFILYGFPKSRSKGGTLDTQLIKKYLPWDGEPKLSGALELECDGKQFRIERTQRETAAGRVSVVDRLANEIPIETTPGEYFFNVDYETFLRTFISRQTDSAFFKTDGIESALKNLVSTGDESVSFDNALAILTKKKTPLEHSGKTGGLIYSIPKQIKQLQQHRQELISKLSEYENIEEQLRVSKRQLKSLRAEEKELSELVSKAKSNDCARLLEKILALDCQIEGCNVDKERESRLKAAETLFTKYEFASQALARARAEYEKLRSEQKTKKFRLWPIATFGSALLAVGGAVTFTLNKTFIAAGLWAAALMIGLVSIISSVQKKSGMKAQIGKAKADVEACQKEAERYRTLCTATGFSGKEEISAAISRLGERSQLHFLKQQRQELIGEMSIEQITESARGGDVNGISFLQVQEQLTAAAMRSSRLVEIISVLESEFAQKSRVCQDIYMADKQISELEAEYKRCRYQNGVLGIAIEALQSAHSTVSSMYSPILSEKASEALYAFTDGKYDKVFVDTKFGIFLRSGSQTKELGYFSKGTKEAVYFALRHAIGEIISGGLPAVLDDPFCTLDKEREKKAREYLKQISKSKQVIVFCAK